MDNRKVLLVSYHFPPDPAVGALRPAKTAKHLARLGWRPYVLTVKERYLRGQDEGRLADVEGIPVIRTAMWPSVSQLVLRLTDRVSVLQRLRTAGARNRPRPIDNWARAQVRRGGPPEILRRHLDALFELPDKQIGWLLPAVWAAYRVIKRERIALVVTSSPPPTTALVGLALSWLTDAKLVTDLRDPWFAPLGRPADCSNALSDWIQRWLERQLMRRSSRVVTTTEQYRQFLAATYPDVPADRFATIWNGYDAEDFADVPAPAARRGVTVAYLGTFYFGRTPRAFLRAVAELIREGAITRSELQIRFIGDVRQAEGESVAALVQSERLDGCVTIEDPVSHRQALGIMKAADVLLLLAPDQYYCIPAKAFEYMGAGARILCLARDGATAALIRQTGTGAVVEPDDVGGIKAALRSLLDHCGSGQIGRPDGVARYERRILAAEFAKVLETCLAGGREGGRSRAARSSDRPAGRDAAGRGKLTAFP
jgi:glycosyltransferase involved in cell wall biosynthesis